MFKEQEKGLFDSKKVRCINDILVSVGLPEAIFTKQLSKNLD